MRFATKQFDLVNASACATYSALAYQAVSGAYTAIHDPATDTHCLIVEQPDCFIIAFRGTASIRNWITDARFERTTLVSGDDGSDCKIHLGFETAFNSVFTQIYKTLGGSPVFKIQNCKPLFITGHSLGGALAILAAYELQRNGFQIAQVYTFGQPRVGNGDFKARYNAALGDRTFRVVYKEDIVPRIPHLPAWHDPYRHVGSEVFISSIDAGELWMDPPLWRLLISDAWGIYRAFIVSKFAGAIDPIRDHKMSNYAAALAGMPYEK